MKKSQKKIKKQNNLEIENNAILDKILSERLLADYSVQDEVKYYYYSQINMLQH